jgi:hypothetical protein
MKQKLHRVCLLKISKIFSINTTLLVIIFFGGSVFAQSDMSEKTIAKASEKKENKQEKKNAASLLEWPPTLPGGKQVATDMSADFLQKRRLLLTFFIYQGKIVRPNYGQYGEMVLQQAQNIIPALAVMSLHAEKDRCMNMILKPNRSV